jgi:hypothetical protein
MSVDASPARAGFDLKATHVICDAFDRAWRRLQERGGELVTAEWSSATRTILARRIIERAASGAHDATELCDDALRYLEEHPPFSGTSSLA